VALAFGTILYPVDSTDIDCLAKWLSHWQSICTYGNREEVREMLYYALVFFVIALLAAFLGFGGIAVAFAGIAKILFFLFVVLFLVSLIMHVGRRA
jgi:uncharacterized membrane protein YtjA (UPF0391 family)